MLSYLLFVFVAGMSTMTDVEGQEHYDNFFEEVFVELNDKVCFYQLEIVFVCSVKTKSTEVRNCLKVACDIIQVLANFAF